MPRDGAAATVVLFSGGAGGIGYKNGTPQSGNFLIRSRDEFAQVGLNVALMGNPDDFKKLTPQFRRSAEHVDDVSHVLEDIAIRSKAPIWLVGTSQGTLSAAANAAELGSRLAGAVLTSTVTGQQAGGSANDIALEKISVPVLIYHHKQDSCRITPAYAAERLIKRLTLASVKKYIEVDGGKDPVGDPCEAFHYHGFIGMESQAVQQITSWIKSPAN
jgi:pimeloyl-ACP methyl ester carboxylesterase